MLEYRAARVLLFSVLATTLFAGAQATCAAQANESRPTRVIQLVNVTANLEKTIDAKKNKAGDPVTAKSTVATTLGDGTPVPAGSVLMGQINSIIPSVKKGDSILVFTFDKLAIKNGKEIPIKAVVVLVSSFGSTFGEEQANNDPDANRPAAASVGTPGAAGGVIAHPTGDSTGLHPISGLTLSGSVNDVTSGTLTQAHKNIHLTNSTQLIVSVAALP
ncbi:MAG: hypothetical protein WA419_13210 [Silvibacterium sp.]